MPWAMEKEYEHLVKTRGIEDHDRDLIHDLSRRLDCLWRFDQYLSNAGGRAEIQEFWRTAKWQEQKSMQQTKKLIQLVKSNCF